MSSTTRYTDYDPFARIHNESWGLEVSEFAIPHLEQLALPYLPEKAHILDLCCGTGQLAQYLLEKGYQVTGLDGSEAMLDYARENAPSSEFILNDARLFDLPPTFHGVISTTFALNHVISIEELTCVFKNVYAALLENGWFVFDLSLEDRYQGSWNRSASGDVRDEYVWAMRRSYNPEDKIGEIKITIFQLVKENWQRLDTTWLVKGYSKAEVQSALKYVGFKEVSVYNAERDLAKPGEAGTVYFVCRK